MTTHHGTTEADTVAEVNFNDDAGSIAVFNYAGTDLLLVRVDGGDPAIGQHDTRIVPPGVRRVITRDLEGPTAIRLLSTGVVSYEIEY